jgi:phosphoribosylformylglycinamidine (FGAM) synthase-like amidotransferase family enzyme
MKRYEVISMSEEVEETAEAPEKDAKYITATLSKTDDAKLIQKYSRLIKIGNFSARDVFDAGVAALMESEQYQEALKDLKAEMGE